jgi:hypothetical protein
VISRAYINKTLTVELVSWGSSTVRAKWLFECGRQLPGQLVQGVWDFQY